MALNLVTKVFEDGSKTEEIVSGPVVHRPGIDPGKHVHVRRFRYEVKCEVIRPGIFHNKYGDGKTYIIPQWVECHPDTEMEDIISIFPNPKPIKTKNKEFKFISKSSGVEYVVRVNGDKIKCNCPGTWRAKDKRCKHVKEVEKKCAVK